MVLRGLFYRILGRTTIATADDMYRVDAAADAKKSSGSYMAKGGFKHLKNIQASYHELRKPLMGHGPNRDCY